MTPDICSLFHQPFGAAPSHQLSILVWHQNLITAPSAHESPACIKTVDVASQSAICQRQLRIILPENNMSKGRDLEVWIYSHVTRYHKGPVAESPWSKFFFFLWGGEGGHGNHLKLWCPLCAGQKSYTLSWMAVFYITSTEISFGTLKKYLMQQLRLKG